MTLISLADEPRAERDPLRPAWVLQSDLGQFEREGFLGPMRVFTPAQCRQIARYLKSGGHPPAADWDKGRAVHERFLYELAMHPAIRRVVTTVLGDHVALWGASAVVRAPGVRHPWHSDIESSAPGGGFVTVWVGLEGTTRQSSLQLISRSHTLNRTVQQCRAERGIRRDEATPEYLLDLVRQDEPEAVLVQADMTNGDALVFDGRLWHGSHNGRRRGRRLALLLQYAAVDRPVRIPDFSQLDWPFRFHAEPRPAVILISGSDTSAANRVVAPPAPEPSHHSPTRPMITTVIHQFPLAADHPQGEAWRVWPAFRGPTSILSAMSCHASLLQPGHRPHPPHAHGDEELLVPLAGEVELEIPDGTDDPSPRIERMGPGSFVYYPRGQHHTIRNCGRSPAAYVMFKWSARTLNYPVGLPPLGTTVQHFGAMHAPRSAPPFHTTRLLEAPTDYLGTLHAHLTVLQAGAGYTPHIDAYDVAIVTLDGTVETLGNRVAPYSVIYYAAGERHGMRNVGPTPARYLVFEFRAPALLGGLARSPLRRVLRLGRRVVRGITTAVSR
jgi:mannose-6-phosphate isomerase-like protein (cupin superfamily)